MGLARALTFGGAVALASASVSDWFSYNYKEACGWTCYSPIESGEVSVRDLPRSALRPLADPMSGFAGLGPWVSAALVALVLVALLAVALSVRGRAVPRTAAVAAVLAAGAIVVRTVTQPDVGFDRTIPNRLVSVEAAAYVGAAGAIAAALGVALLVRRGRLESPVA